MPLPAMTLLRIMGDEKLKIGYICISTADPNIARQEVLTKELRVNHVYIDKR